MYNTSSVFQIKKKSLDKAKEEERIAKEFAEMENAAMKAYQEDLKRLGVNITGSCECYSDFEDIVVCYIGLFVIGRQVIEKWILSQDSWEKW